MNVSAQVIPIKEQQQIPDFPEIVDSTIRASEAALTYERLREVLIYDSETGLFFWKIRNSSRCKKGWFKGSSGQPYPRITIDKRTYFAHRVAYFYTYNRWPILIDHKSHDTEDTRINNLRNVTRTQNGWNKRPRGIVGLKGVSLHKQSKKYRARITINKSQILLGYFNTPEEAAQAYESMAIKVQGDLRYKREDDAGIYK